MNRRLPRILLLVVLLLSMVGVFKGGVPSVQPVMAQEDCTPYPSTAEQAESMLSEEPQGEDFQILSEYVTPDPPNADENLTKNLTIVSVTDGVGITFVSQQTSIILVDEGFVELHVCSGDVFVQEGPNSAPHPVDGGFAKLEAGAAVFVDAGDEYYLISPPSDATPSTSIQQLDYELSNDVLPDPNLATPAAQLTPSCQAEGCTFARQTAAGSLDNQAVDVERSTRREG